MTPNRAPGPKPGDRRHLAHPVGEIASEEHLADPPFASPPTSTQQRYSWPAAAGVRPSATTTSSVDDGEKTSVPLGRGTGRARELDPLDVGLGVDPERPARDVAEGLDLGGLEPGRRVVAGVRRGAPSR